MNAAATTAALTRITNRRERPFGGTSSLGNRFSGMRSLEATNQS